MIENITEAQKKIIIVTSGGVIAFIFCWLFIYIPAKNDIKLLKRNLSDFENSIKQIEDISPKAKTIDEMIIITRKKYGEISKKFSEKEEEGFRGLAKIAQELGIDIKSIKPELKRDLVDKNKTKIEIEGKTIKSVFVSIEMDCGYSDLVSYIKKLKEELPAHLTIENLRISQIPNDKSKLKIILDLNFYILS